MPRVELETFGGRLPPYISMICSLIDSTDACSTLKAVYHGSSLLGPQREQRALPLLDVLCGERDGSGGNRARSEAEDYDR